jgi:hypothetical protein
MPQNGGHKDVAVGSTAAVLGRPRAAALYGIAHSSPLLLLKKLHCNMKLCCEQARAFLLSSFLYSAVAPRSDRSTN